MTPATGPLMQSEDCPRHTAVILTALKTETRAVRAFLQNTHERTCQTGERTYTEGRFHQQSDGQGAMAPWRILLREVGRDQGGAAEGTRYAADDWQPDIVIFVGCAGGRPKKIRHFNVIVAQSVSYYEKAKIEEGRVRHHIETYQLPAHRFLDVARIVRDRTVSSGRLAWVNRVERISPLSNRLVECGALDDLDATIEPIASGEKVITDPESPLWKQLENEVYRIVATETEAAGFATARCEDKEKRPIPRLMVRGISDLLSDKNQTEEEARIADPSRPKYLADMSDAELRQRIAVTAAAAFVFEVLAQYTASERVNESLSSSLPPDHSVAKHGKVTIWLDDNTDEAALQRMAKFCALVAECGGEVNVRDCRPGGSRFVDLDGDSNSLALIAALSESGLLIGLIGGNARLESIDNPDPSKINPALGGLIQAIHLLGNGDRWQDGQTSLDGLLKANPSWRPSLIRLMEAFAQGLVNALHDLGSDSQRADILLNELRTLEKRHFDNTRIKEMLAHGLLNAANNSGVDLLRVDMLIDELHQLKNHHPDSVEIRTELARGLVNALYGVGGDAIRAENLLGKLRECAQQYQNDANIQRLFALGLVNALSYVGADRLRAQKLLDELRHLSLRYPDNVDISKQFTLMLLTALSDTGFDRSRIGKLLDELWQLAKRHIDNSEIRNLAATGFVNAIYYAGSDFQRADTLLDELRQWEQRLPEDTAIPKLLAMGLVNALGGARSDTQRADLLLDELSQLATRHPEAPDIRTQFAMGLLNATNIEKFDNLRVNTLIRKLRLLAKRYPDEAGVSEPLASGLRNAINREGPDTKRVDSLLHELRKLVNRHPNSSKLRTLRAEGLVSAVHFAGSDKARADTLLKELRFLAKRHPNEATLREALSKGCFNAFNNAAPLTPRANRLLNELRQLSADNSHEVEIRTQLAQGLVNSLIAAVDNQVPLDQHMREVETFAAHHPDDPFVRSHMLPLLATLKGDGPR